MSTTRVQVTQEQVNFALVKLITHTTYRLDQKGDGAFLSSEEYLKVIEEEVAELKVADLVEGKDGKVWELLDIAYACVFAIASHEAGGVKR